MKSPQPDHVEAATVRGWLDRPDTVTVLDVRTPAEFQTAHIRGSYNLPLTLLAEHAEQIAARLDRQVVLVCGSGMRACEARQHLAGVGADRVHVLDGGLTAYTATVGANDPTVVRGQPRWALERQVRMVAGTLVLAGLALGRRLPRARLITGGVRYRAGPVGAHRHLHDGPDPGGSALQPGIPGPHSCRGPRPAPNHPAPDRRTPVVSRGRRWGTTVNSNRATTNGQRGGQDHGGRWAGPRLGVDGAVLAERYARGELSTEEYRERLRILGEDT